MSTKSEIYSTVPTGLIEKIATANAIDANLVSAIVMAESRGDPYAIRFEPRYRYFYYPRTFAENIGITLETEQVLQACSFGLMQVMGGVFRELGFKEILTKTFDQSVNLKYGCVKLKKLFQKYGDETDVVAAYNAGSVVKTTGGLYTNQTYIDRIHSYLFELRKPL